MGRMVRGPGRGKQQPGFVHEGRREFNCCLSPSSRRCLLQIPVWKRWNAYIDSWPSWQHWTPDVTLLTRNTMTSLCFCFFKTIRWITINSWGTVYGWKFILSLSLIRSWMLRKHELFKQVQKSKSLMFRSHCCNSIYWTLEPKPTFIWRM